MYGFLSKPKANYQCKVDNGNISILSDTTPDKGGMGKGIRPHELLKAALAACMNISIQRKAEKENITLSEVITQVNFHFPRRERLNYEYKLEEIIPFNFNNYGGFYCDNIHANDFTQDFFNSNRGNNFDSIEFDHPILFYH